MEIQRDCTGKMSNEYDDKVSKKSVPRGMVLLVLTIVVIAGAGAYLFLTRSGGGGGGDNTGGAGGSGGTGGPGGSGGTGAISRLTGTTLEDAVTQIKSYATAQGYSDAQLTYTAQGSNFTENGKVDWSDIVLYSSSANMKVEYLDPGTCNISSASIPIPTVTSYLDTSQIATLNPGIWDFAEGENSLSIEVKIDNFQGPGPYNGQMAWRVTVYYGTPGELETWERWLTITTGQQMSA